jgi:ATP-dependent RNA helicase DOB1
MSSNLFSFLDDIPPENGHDPNGKDPVDSPELSNTVPKKRKAGPEKTLNSIHEDHMQDAKDEPSSSKRPRVASPKPVVVDEFETEARREVAAIAGLTGGVEPGSRLELRHQVHSSSTMDFRRGILYFLVGSPSSRGTSRL